MNNKTSNNTKIKHLETIISNQNKENQLLKLQVEDQKLEMEYMRQ